MIRIKHLKCCSKIVTIKYTFYVYVKNDLTSVLKLEKINKLFHYTRRFGWPTVILLLAPAGGWGRV